MEVSMHQKLNERVVDLNPQETAEWVESLDQVIDQADYNVWRSSFGNTYNFAGGAAIGVVVPEPKSSWLLITTILCVSWPNRCIRALSKTDRGQSRYVVD